LQSARLVAAVGELGSLDLMSSVSLYVLAGVVQIAPILLGVFAYKQQQSEARSDTRAIISHQTTSTDRIVAALKRTKQVAA
jgi:hypothetical protein